MCRPTTCEVCGKTTWKGCGKHIDSVREQVRFLRKPLQLALGPSGIVARRLRKD